MALCLATAAVVTLVALNAWVADDAFVSLRTVDNAVNGFGLRWNTTERVQAFTHPLWLLLLIPFYAVTREAFLTTLAVSIACSGAAVVVAVMRGWRRPCLTVGILLAPLAGSSAFLDYATSGLETPLTFLLLALFAAQASRADDADPPLRRLSLLVGLAACNRLDTLLVYLPAMALLLLRHRRGGAWRRVWPGALPLAVWELFSLFYYGFAFPNTKYAKLGAGIPQASVLKQGWAYTVDLFAHHPVSAVLLVVGLAAAGWEARAWWGHRRQAPPGPLPAATVGLGAGAFAYGVYIVWVGGDFMSGRFWVTPIFAAALVLHGVMLRRPARHDTRILGAVVLLVGVLRLLPAHPYHDFTRGIADERRLYAGTNALINYRRDNNPAHFRLSPRARQDRAEAERRRVTGEPDRVIARWDVIGMVGYYVGPHVVVLDPLALGDPLLARLPAANLVQWRPGHLMREVPVGYEHFLRTGSLDGMHPGLREYYTHLRRIVTGPLWSWERLRTIIAFNLGLYEPLRESYLEPVSLGARPLKSVATPAPVGGAWDVPGTVRLPPRTILTLSATSPVAASVLDIGTEAFGLYRVTFYRGGERLGVVMVPERNGARTHQMVSRTFTLPPEVRGAMVDRVTVEPRGGRRPIGGNGLYSLGHLRLE